MTGFQFVEKWPDVDCFVPECVQSVEYLLQLCPALSVQYTFPMNHFLIRVRQILQQRPIHEEHIQKLFFSQTIGLSPGILFQHILQPIRMEIVEQIKQLILLKELNNFVNTSQSLIGSIGILNLPENINQHHPFIFLEIVTFRFFLLDTKLLTEHIRKVLFDLLDVSEGELLVTQPLLH